MIQHHIREMKGVAEYAGFYFNGNIQSINDLYPDQSFEDKH